MDQRMTPMMEQYRSIKRTLPADTILFFRLGDFYEMFFEDAVHCSEILNITLTGRDGGPVGRVPMCGVPYHAFQPYVRALLDKNLKVAICEQIGDPALARGLVERRVTRIITPATFLDEETKTGRPEYMAAVAAQGQEAALAWADLATGEFRVRQTPRDRVAAELAVLEPREVVLARGLADSSGLVPFLKENLRCSITLVDDWVFAPSEGSRLLKEAFRLATERGIPFHDSPLAVAAAGAVVYTLKDHLQMALGHLNLPLLLESNRVMTLDRQTLKNLELVSGLSGNNRAGSLLGVIDQTLTPMGARVLFHWVTHPLVDLGQIQYRQEATARLAGDLTWTQTVRSLCKGVRDIERVLSRLSAGVANARDLISLKEFLARIPQIREALSERESRMLSDLLNVLQPIPELKEKIERAIVDAPPITLREGGLIRDGYSQPLDELRRISTDGKSWLIQFQQKEIQRTGMKSLRIKYSQVFGYAIEVSRSNLHLVPPDYTRRQTLANAERFITPELKQWDEQISGAQEKIRGLEHQLFQEIREEVLSRLNPMQEMARAVGTLDALASLAVAAIQKGWVRPEVTDSLELVIREGRHPVVEAMLPAGQFVENDTLLDGEENQLILLTGPNMAGKSTFIRQVAQIVLLSQIGSFVPAACARIGRVDRIFTRIGASDDLARGESTFMVEMVEMAQILQMATDKSLLILDEVGRGTSTFDGVSLAWAICERLVQGEARPRTLFATHYHELIRLEEESGRIKNHTILVKETPEGILFLRKVVRGGSDRSYGIHVAELAGIPRQVTRRAAQILEILEKENAQATRMIEGKEV